MSEQKNNPHEAASLKRGHHPILGWMAGPVTIVPGTDLTAPAYPEWADIAEQSCDDLARLIQEGMAEKKS